MVSNIGRKAIGIVLVILFIGAAIIPSTGTIVKEKLINPLSGGNTLYVGGSGPYNYTKIQDAIDNASDGDTVYVYDESSPYYEHVQVNNKSINLIGENMHTTIIDGGGSINVVWIHLSDWVNISGFTIQKCGNSGDYAGIIMLKSDFCNITGNIITSNNCYGIILAGSSGSTIKGNIITSNLDDGIKLSGSDSITITNNIITSNNHNGILLGGNCYYNTITCNIISDNTDGINSLCPLSTRNGDNTISGNSITSNNNSGIILYGTSFYGTNHSTITCNNISNNHYGIYLSDSSGNNITDNNISSNNDNGIHLRYSNDNTVTENTISNNEDDGIYIYDSYSNTITSNLFKNCDYGIFLSSSNSNNITGNNISKNNRGIWITGDYNVIRSNIISDNNYGISIGAIARVRTLKALYFHSIFNNIIKNNFFDNEQDAHFTNSILNRWNQNYWGTSRILPKFIFGEIGIWPIWQNPSIRPCLIPQIDWRPAQEPHNIEV